MSILLLLPLSVSAVSTDNLQSHWTLDEASGVRYDSHGSNDLSDRNTVLNTSLGVLDNAAIFDDSLSEGLYKSDASQSPDLSIGSGDLSLSIWVKLHDKASNQTLISKYDSGNTYREYWLFYDSTADRFAFRVFNSNTVNDTVNADTLGSPSTDTWYHIVAYVDNTSNNIGIVVNDGTADTASLTVTTHDGFAYFNLGMEDDPSGTTYAHIDGELDEAMVFDAVLTGADIEDLYGGGNPPEYPFTEAATSTPASTTYSNGEMISSICVYNAPTTTCDYAYASSTDVDVTINFLFLLFILTLIVAFGSAYVTYKLL